MAGVILIVLCRIETNLIRDPENDAAYVVLADLKKLAQIHLADLLDRSATLPQENFADLPARGWIIE
jgi:hypothetical protein